MAPKKDFVGVSGSGSVQWTISDEWQLGLSVSRAERAPATEELFSNVEGSGPDEWIVHAATGAIELGNPDIDTEVSNNVDLSGRWAGNSHSIDLAIFYNDFRDYINLLNTGVSVGEAPVLRYAQQDAKFHGFEFNSEFEIAMIADGKLSIVIFGDSIRGELNAGGDVPRLPPDRLGARLVWRGDSAELWGRVIDASAQHRPGNNEEPTDAYTRWDLGVDYQLPLGGSDLTVFFEFKNISDEEIRLSTSFLRDVAPEAGRSVELGFRLMM